jgi:hypothetical protein
MCIRHLETFLLPPLLRYAVVFGCLPSNCVLVDNVQSSVWIAIFVTVFTDGSKRKRQRRGREVKGSI